MSNGHPPATWLTQELERDFGPLQPLLYRWYVVEEKSGAWIADYLGVSSATVYRYLAGYGYNLLELVARGREVVMGRAG